MTLLIISLAVVAISLLGPLFVKEVRPTAGQGVPSPCTETFDLADRHCRIGLDQRSIFDD